MNRVATAIRNRPLVALGATGLVGATSYKKLKEELRLEKDAQKKRVLVLPFHRMSIVEEKKSPASAFLSNLTNTIENNGPGGEKIIEMQADELISLIHDAAEDPSIVSIFGEFGNGGGISVGGWAHLEEIRGALESFSTSKTSSVGNEEVEESSENPRKGKVMYAYSNTFGGIQSMREYYLASVFQKIHLQPQGDLNLYGLHATNVFIRDFLRKYGITVHVWKHGAYKNMANMFTHSNYTKEHYENTAGILLPIHKQVCKSIYRSRYEQLKKYGYNFDKFWSMVENSGSLPADVAQQIGFVDHLPLKNPLKALVNNNKEEKRSKNKQVDISTSNSSDAASAVEDDTKKELGEDKPFIEKWKLQTDVDNFSADSEILIDAYGRQRAKLKEKKNSSSVMRQLFSLRGDESANSHKEKIAVIKINGTIGEAVARKAEKALRKVKEEKDIKCVVLRVDSPGGSINACEALYQEIQDIPQKVVVSFGNVSASGGYYISSSAERIFALPSTVTGSIGVVMMRMDFKELLKQHGITVDSIPTSDLSGSNDPLFPLNKQMHENFTNQADRSYHRFKSLVSDGRNLSMKAVEKIAKGRVWTGQEASEIGLVDELGGLNEAIQYAQKTFTSNGDAEVISWPPKKPLWQVLMDARNGDDDEVLDQVDANILHATCRTILTGENNWGTIINKIGRGCGYSLFGNDCFAHPPLPVSSGVMLTVNENSAIQCMLEDVNISKEIFQSEGSCTP